MAILLLAAALVALATAGSDHVAAGLLATRSGDVPSVIGDWAGAETQVNPSGRYVVHLHIRQLRPNEVDGSVFYSNGTTFQIDCKADLRLTAITNTPGGFPSYTFQETITRDSRGTCVAAVDTVKLLDSDTLSVSFTVPNRPITGSGTLKRELPAGSATGTVTVNGQPFVGGVIQYGSIVDVTAGTLNVSTDLGDLTVYGAAGIRSRFRLMRPNASSIEFDLVGGDFSTCNGRALAAYQRKKKKTVRLVWAKGKGRFRSAGRDSVASVHGTNWLTEDRCDGTLTVVKEGVVTVRDLRRRKTVTVAAGHSYLALHRPKRR